jgi:hypothetical protein
MLGCEGDIDFTEGLYEGTEAFGRPFMFVCVCVYICFNLPVLGKNNHCLEESVNSL